MGSHFSSLMCNENFQLLRGNPSIPSFQIITIFQSFSVIWIKSLSIFLTAVFYWDGKEFACNTGDLGSIPGSGGSPGGGNSYPLQYSYLENSMNRGAWQATVHGVAKSWTWLSNFIYWSRKAEPKQSRPFFQPSLCLLVVYASPLGEGWCAHHRPRYMAPVNLRQAVNSRER